MVPAVTHKKKPTQLVSECALLDRARDGDRQAFSELISRHQEGLAATVVAMLGPSNDVDDIVQETVIKFYHGLDRFRGEAAVGTYLKRMVINRTLDVLRRRKRFLDRFVRTDEMVLTLVDPERNGGQILEAEERKKMVRRAISALNPKHRAVVVLRLIEGYSTEETAQMLGIAYGTVLSRLSRAQKKIQVLLAPYMGEMPH